MQTLLASLGFCACIILLTEGRLPNIVEDRTDKWKDVFRVTPQPPVTLDEILVYNGFPLDNLQYILDYKQAAWVERFKRSIEIPERSFTKAQRHTNCKDLLSPGKITFKQYTANYIASIAQWAYSTERFVERDVSPFIAQLRGDENQYQLKFLRSNCDIASYSGCWLVTEMKQIDFYIINAAKYKTLISGMCDLCIIAECKITCPQGTFATKEASYDTESNLQKTQFECLPCPPGTWNTCLRSNECSW
jgi:hypothetical protein